MKNPVLHHQFEEKKVLLLLVGREEREKLPLLLERQEKLHLGEGRVILHHEREQVTLLLEGKVGVLVLLLLLLLQVEVCSRLMGEGALWVA